MSRGRPPPDISTMVSLKVDNISYRTMSDDLRRIFDRYGEIGDIHIPRDRYSNQSKGFAFVRFFGKRDAEHAMEREDGRYVDGREIRVAMARYERPYDERDGSGARDSRSDRPDRERRRRSRSRSRSPRRRSRSRSPRRSRGSGDAAPADDERNGERSASRSATPEDGADNADAPAEGSKSPSRSP